MVKNCIFDLGKYFGLENGTNFQETINYELPSLCHKILLLLKEKEHTVVEYIDNITNLIHGEDRDIILGIIGERKHLNKKLKFREYINSQNIESTKKKI